MSVEQIASFISEVSKQDGAEKLRRLKLIHIVKGNRLGDEILIVTVPDEVASEWILASAKKLYKTAGEEAAALAGGVQRYAVAAYLGDNTRSSSRMILTMAAADDDGDDRIGTEGPDAEGLTAQAMRHTEFFARIASQGAMLQMREMRIEVTSLREENAGLRRERLENIRIMEEVYSDKADRDALTRRSDVKTKALEAGAEKLMLLVPFVLNHLAGKKLLPENGTALVLLQSLAQSITREQFEAMKGVLNPDQIAALVSTMTSVSKLADAEKKTEDQHKNGALVPSATLAERLARMAGEPLS